MKKYIILLVLPVLLAECTDKFEEYNVDQKSPANVAGEALFSNAQKSLVDQVSSTNVNLNVWKLFAQYWTETTYTDEANYDIVNRTIPDLTFREYYRGFLQDFDVADSLIASAKTTNEMAQMENLNKRAIIELHIAYSYQQLVDIFGNIPYSQALNVNNISPVYDDAFTIYKDLLARIDAALAQLNPAYGSFGDADIIYGGDVEKWIKFGNALKIKMGTTIADFDPALAQSVIEPAAPLAFTSSDDNALFMYLSSTPNNNPINNDLVLSGRDDFVPANTIVDIMNTLNDPRRPLYFTTTAGGTYVGGIYGETSPYSQYSHISDQIHDPTFPGILLTYDEVQFYLAEAAARGFNVGGTPDVFYNNAIKESILFWGGTQAEVDAYLATPTVAYATATGDWRQKIGTQEWIAFYTRGLEGYTTWRRLDYPVLNIPPAITTYGEIPTRFTYPINEQTLNAANYTKASQDIGGDELTTKLFWDVF